MEPTIGRIVVYTTTDQDQRMINEHPHNTPREQSPAIIVAVLDEETVNLKVLIDGCGELYRKEVVQGNEPGQWNWPVVQNMTSSTENVNLDIQEDPETVLTEGFSKLETILDADQSMGNLGNDPGALGTAEIPDESESATPLVVLDESTGKHKAVAKPKAVKKAEEPTVFVTNNPAA